MTRLLVASVVLALDQATKYYGDVAWNDEAVLGVADPPTLLLLAGIALFAAVAYRQHPAWAAGLVVGGAVGNGLDLLVLGAVRDVIHVGNVSANVADVAITVGVLACAYRLMKGGDHRGLRPEGSRRRAPARGGSRRPVPALHALTGSRGAVPAAQGTAPRPTEELELS